MILSSAPVRSALSVLALAVAATLSACGGSSGDDGDLSADTPSDDVAIPAGGAGAGSVVDQIGTDDDSAAIMTGDITRYGVVTVGDEAGEASDAVAGFFDLSAGISTGAFGAALDPDVAECLVIPAGGDIGFAAVSAGFLPSPTGADATSIDIGETLQITSAGSTWVELQPMTIGGNRLYDVASGSVLPDGPVPQDLTVDVPDGAFPAFTAAVLPTVEPLVGFDDGAGDTIGADTRFSWEPGSDAGTKIRLTYVTNASFFADDGGLTLGCTVPDTGSFAFDDETRTALGADFEGAAFVVSRVAIDTAQEDDALLILVRESSATN